jgi:DNA-directed RNA polymerase subunit RPC12/RpoP
MRPRSTDTITKRGRGVAAGFLLGAGAGSIIFFAGFLLCLMGIGVFVGTPMILVALAAPLVIAVSRSRIRYRQGRCPYCDALVDVAWAAGGFNCPACEQRVLVKGNRFHTLE